ncbi:type IV secretory system conjugative DNA transfer family protein [Pseudaestuariivita atlantica]|uniref:type IV secretory system conjugative DNA transfer family protein n=1 Tax=Pseudaestuariivita atlantica TaxID=1317121 RepID=UPI0009E20963|nr:type IV secretory system conjugative DNA transfer family protein [Pseudaestuariivita atlantica]
MDRGRIALGIFLLTVLSAGFGYVFASAFLTFRDLGLRAEIDFLWLARNYLSLRRMRPDDFQLANLIIGGTAFAGMLLSAVLSGTALTKFGKTHWQRAGELKRNGFFTAPGSGFILGKMTSPRRRGRYLSSSVYPHVLCVAPTGRGKTTGFVIPNLLTFRGSAVVLDVKGENFEATARYRAADGDDVYRFAPTDWNDRRSHRYNPLLRIAGIRNPNQQQMELQLLATLFLQTDNDRTSGLLKGGIDLFVAAGLLAFERKRPTLGEIYRITASGGDKRKEFMKRRDEVQNTAAKLIFERMASTNNDTLTSYISLLMTSGLDQWSNPAIDAATATSDFDFRTIRKKPFSVYLVVAPNMVRPMAALIRLFFSDLIASLQDREPAPDEPWPVMIMLDEFNRLGKMPIVVESIETLRSYRGHLAIVTQTIPALDEIYGENTRRALQGNAGIKLYLTPSDEKTVEELSGAVGMTTKRVVTRSRSIGRNPFEGRSMSERTEETSLLPKDEARRMSLDDIVMVVDAQMPVRAKRIRYFDDPFFKSIHKGQSGELPFPKVFPEEEPRDQATKVGQEEQVAARSAEDVAKAQGVKARSSRKSPSKRVETSIAAAQTTASKGTTLATSRRKKSAKALREHGLTTDQAELDLTVQQSFKLTDMVAIDETGAKAAVQSTISALAEIGAEDPAGQGGGAASGKAILAAADAETNSDGDGDTFPLSEDNGDGDISEITKHRVRDGEDIDAEFREQALTHKV